MASSIRTRPRHSNHLHTSDDDRASNLSTNSSQLESLIPTMSQYESSTYTIHRQVKASLHMVGENESTTNSHTKNISDGINVNDDRTSNDVNDEHKKDKFFRYRCLRNTRNLSISSKKFGFISALLIFFLFFFWLESSSSSGGNSNRQKQLDEFLNYWVGGIGDHPLRALSMYISLYMISIICLLPGTPLTIGGGFAFSKTFGFRSGILVVTIAVSISSTTGYTACFFLGRYFLQDKMKQKLLQKYPMFEVIDAAISEKATYVMSLLHLTPIIPFGPISYMCGGLTSMNGISFAIANLASLPLHILYTFIGASAGRLLTSRNLESTNGKETNDIVDTDNNQMNTTLEGDQDGHEKWMVLLGIVMSILSISLLTRLVKKELDRVLKNKGNVSNKEVLGESSEIFINNDEGVIVI